MKEKKEEEEELLAQVFCHLWVSPSCVQQQQQHEQEGQYHYHRQWQYQQASLSHQHKQSAVLAIVVVPSAIPMLDTHRWPAEAVHPVPRTRLRMVRSMERKRWEQRIVAIGRRHHGCWWCLDSCRGDSSNDDLYS